MDDEKSKNADTHASSTQSDKKAPDTKPDDRAAIPVDSEGPKGDDKEQLLAELREQLSDLKRAMSDPSSAPADELLHTRKEEYQAWVGTKDRLLRLETVVQEAVDAARELVKRDDKYRPIRGESLALTVEVTDAKGKTKRTGSMTKALKEMEPGEIESVRMRTNKHVLAREGLPWLELTLGPAQTWNRGVQLEISGADKPWVGATYDAITTELKKDVPRWSWLRSSLGRVVMWIVIAIPINILMLRLLEPSQRGDAALNVGLFAGAVAAGIVVLVVRWGLLDLEVVQRGSSARIVRIIVAITITIGFIASVGQLVSGF